MNYSLYTCNTGCLALAVSLLVQTGIMSSLITFTLLTLPQNPKSLVRLRAHTFVYFELIE